MAPQAVPVRTMITRYLLGRMQLTTREVREDFQEFFRSKGHEIVRSAPLVPQGDPTLLFINAGMNQFKDVFLGLGERDHTRVANAQKCLRVSGKHNDLDEVGHDTYHHTFFEMLGNWSFGDYFKEEAVTWAWELLTERWGLDPSRLYATFHSGDSELGLETDREAAEIWARQPRMLDDHVLHYGSGENFWMMGNSGPCGPCSEIHYDLRHESEVQQVPGHKLVNAGHPKVIELWNLVFIQYNAVGDGTIQPLNSKHVDTGMGLERVAAVLQGQDSTYDTDAFAPLFSAIASRSPLSYVVGYDDIRDEEAREKARIAMRVVADHVRAVAFAIADGVTPGNVGQGYVIRRLLRRAVRYGYQFLGFRKPFLHDLTKTVVNQLAHAYDELEAHQRAIERAVRSEEQAFLRTLGRGIGLFETIVPHLQRLRRTGASDGKDVLKSDGRMVNLLQKAYGTQAESSDIEHRVVRAAAKSRIPGAVAFLLHDTYGFPLDLTRLMAAEEGLSVDMEGYEVRMQEQRDRARRDRTAGQVRTADTGWTAVAKGSDSAFVGHDTTALQNTVLRWVRQEPPYAVVLDQTPFYPESGGQQGDHGTLLIGGEELRVLDTRRADGRILHLVDRLPQELDAPVEARVDTVRRLRLTKHHTATHLMHAALRETLGPGVAQKGSLVAPDHLRFDFSYPRRVSAEDIARVQRRVNEVIQRNIEVETLDGVPINEALAMGATALFGEKYGERVRVVIFDEAFSVELCGGTHVNATGALGLFLLRAEGSVAAGIRRVEAIAGLDAMTVVEGEIAELRRVRGSIPGSVNDLADTVAELVSQNRKLEKEVEEMALSHLEDELASMIKDAATVHDTRLVTGCLDDMHMDTLRSLGTTLRERMGGGTVGVLGTRDPAGEKAYLVAVVADDMVSRGINARNLVRSLAGLLDGGGGGKPQLATAGGKRPEKLDAVMEAAPAVIRSMLQE